MLQKKMDTSVVSHRVYLILVITWQLLAMMTSQARGQLPNRCNTQCLYEYLPVCGSDGSTYPNLCFMYVASCRNTNLTYMRAGPCRVPDPCNIPCNRRFFPVCGTDGVTYNNPCILMYASCLYGGRGIKQAYTGSCRTTTTTTTTRPSTIRCPFGCTREYIPVCGSDGLTYPNECNFNMVACKDSTLTKVSDRACARQPIFPPTDPKCPLSCNRVYEPICGSDGVTYTNMCTFLMSSCKSLSLAKAKNGPCNPQPRPGDTTSRPSPSFPQPPVTPSGGSSADFCRKDCPFNYEPACGSNGVTYTNKCTFDVAQCMTPSLKVEYNGNCINTLNTNSGGPNVLRSFPQRQGAYPANDDSPPCPFGCTREYIPVCGSDGITYSNQCTFNMVACKDINLRKIKDDECDPQPSATTTTKRPNYILPRIPTTSNSNRGFCRKDCPLTDSPRCGTDGVTYMNKCTFDVAVCVDATLKVAHNGNCS